MQPTDPDQFTDRAWEALVESQDIARKFRSQQLEVEHVMLALLENTERATTILNQTGVQAERIQQDLERFAKRQPKVGVVEQLYLGHGLDVLLDNAKSNTEELQDKCIDIEHLLLAFLQDDRIGKRTCKSLNLNREDLETAVQNLQRTEKAAASKQKLPAEETETTDDEETGEASDEQSTSALAKYGRDLTEEARAGKLDPVIGRDEEIRRVIQVLSRRTKNNPLLIGEPGVGKTAIAEAMAQRIVNGDVPESLKDRQLVSLDLGSTIAGAKYRGDFEKRLRAVLREVALSDGQIVLFIDELHTLVGTGSGSNSSMDAGNLLKPMLARGELRCIGATTLEEYRKYIEKDAALERRFQPILVREPSSEDAISILRGLKERYEVHHGVKIMDSALVAAATLSSRYISDRFLPDKAIDLVDEAAAKLKMEITSKPDELESVERRLMQLEMEKLSLEGEEKHARAGGYSAASDRLEKIQSEIQQLSTTQEKLNSQWQDEKQLLETINTIKEEEDQLRVQIERAERDYDLNRAAQLKYGRLEKIQCDREEYEAKLLKLQSEGSNLLREQVTEEDIAEIVAKWTSIPVNRLLESEKQKLLKLEEQLHQRVIGQQEAVTAVATAIRRARAGMKDPKRPIGSFLFMGPTGVGKTELARALAECLFDTEDALIRIDMSEYMERHAISRLVGAPPGYLGYDEGGQLSKAIRAHPYSVVLFDEVEKAHTDVFNILLQLLDEGRITDSQGRTIDASNTVIVMTSNIGSEYILDVAGDNSYYQEMRSRVITELRRHFRPEFLNRLDETIIFHPLNRDELQEIVGIQVADLEGLLEDQNIHLQITDAAKGYLANVGYDPVYGARPLKRAIQKELQDPIATKILENMFASGDTVVIDVEDQQLTFQAESNRTNKDASSLDLVGKNGTGNAATPENHQETQETSLSVQPAEYEEPQEQKSQYPSSPSTKATNVEVLEDAWETPIDLKPAWSNPSKDDSEDDDYVD